MIPKRKEVRFTFVKSAMNVTTTKKFRKTTEVFEGKKAAMAKKGNEWKYRMQMM